MSRQVRVLVLFFLSQMLTAMEQNDSAVSKNFLCQSRQYNDGRAHRASTNEQLFDALLYQNYQLFCDALEHGADPFAVKDRYSHPLIIQILIGKKRIPIRYARVLFEYAKHKDRTKLQTIVNKPYQRISWVMPLERALILGDVPLINLILSYAWCQAINPVTRDTMLHAAVVSDQAEAVFLLIEMSDAETMQFFLETKNKDNQTPLELTDRLLAEAQLMKQTLANVITFYETHPDAIRFANGIDNPISGAAIGIVQNGINQQVVTLTVERNGEGFSGKVWPSIISRSLEVLNSNTQIALRQNTILNEQYVRARETAEHRLFLHLYLQLLQMISKYVPRLPGSVLSLITLYTLDKKVL